MKEALGTGFIGVAFGFVLSRVGFTSWDEVHSMFTFVDLRLVLTFAFAVALLAGGWLAIARLSAAPPHWSMRSVHPGTAIGAVLFGFGWALSGACPSIALVQLGEGQLSALWTLGGIFAGNWLYSVVHERHFSWTVGTCVDE